MTCRSQLPTACRAQRLPHRILVVRTGANGNRVRLARLARVPALHSLRQLFFDLLERFRGELKGGRLECALYAIPVLPKLVAGPYHVAHLSRPFTMSSTVLTAKPVIRAIWPVVWPLSAKALASAATVSGVRDPLAMRENSFFSCDLFVKVSSSRWRVLA
jgi:hypothetical protein